MSEHSEESKYVTFSEATAMGYGSRSTLYRMISSGKIRAVKIDDSRTRLLREDLASLELPYRPDPEKTYEALARRIAANAPLLSTAQRKELTRILDQSPHDYSES